MTLEWSEKYCSGFAAIDNQHKNIILRMQKMMQMRRMGMGNGEMLEMANDIISVVESHLYLEERYMRDYNYPYRKQHLKEHTILRKNIATIRKAIVKAGNSHKLDEIINWQLEQWLSDHITKYDVDLGRFILSKNGQR